MKNEYETYILFLKPLNLSELDLALLTVLVWGIRKGEKKGEGGGCKWLQKSESKSEPRKMEMFMFVYCKYF